MGRNGELWVGVFLCMSCGAPPPVEPESGTAGSEAPGSAAPDSAAPGSAAPGPAPASVATGPQPSATAVPVVASAEAPSEPPVATPLPRSCPEGQGPVAPGVGKDAAASACYPPGEFVERLCRAIYPGVPLVLFQKGSPWRRGYLRGESKAWTTAPGGQNEKLFQDEEVLVLQEDASRSSGVQYETGAAFYALRWDGTCVKLTEEELMEYVPWGKKTPVLEWKLLDDAQQAALRQNPKIDAAYLAARKQCRSGSGNDAACRKLQTRLSDLVVAHVREGGVLPDPAFRP